jgi:hypothetical protein
VPLDPDDMIRSFEARVSEQPQRPLQVSKIVSGLYGGGSETAAFITDAYASRYPAVDDSEGQR